MTIGKRQCVGSSKLARKSCFKIITSLLKYRREENRNVISKYFQIFLYVGLKKMWCLLKKLLRSLFLLRNLPQQCPPVTLSNQKFFRWWSFSNHGGASLDYKHMGSPKIFFVYTALRQYSSLFEKMGVYKLNGK